VGIHYQCENFEFDGSFFIQSIRNGGQEIVLTKIVERWIFIVAFLVHFIMQLPFYKKLSNTSLDIPWS
jgi:hypothetical protein